MAYMESGENCGVWGTRSNTPDSLQNVNVYSRRAQFDERPHINTVVDGLSNGYRMIVPQRCVADKRAADFQWLEPSCPARNGDIVASGKRCVSTSNCHFVGRQRSGAPTHLRSPAMAAAATVIGRLTDGHTLELAARRAAKPSLCADFR